MPAEPLRRALPAALIVVIFLACTLASPAQERDRIDALEKEGRLAEAFALQMRFVRERGASYNERLPIRVASTPSGTAVRIAATWAAKTPAVLHYPASLIAAGAPLRVELLDASGETLYAVDLDPATFHDLDIDLRSRVPADPPTTSDPAVLAWLEETRAHPPAAAAIAASPGSGEESFEAWCAERRRLYAAWRDGAPAPARAWLDELVTTLRRLVADPPDLGDRRMWTGDESRVELAQSEIGRRGRALGAACALVVPCTWGPAPEGHVERGRLGLRGSDDDRRPGRPEPDGAPAWVRDHASEDPVLLTILDAELVRTGALPLAALGRPVLEMYAPRLVLPSIVGPGEPIEVSTLGASAGYLTAPFAIDLELRLSSLGPALEVQGEPQLTAPQCAAWSQGLATVVARAPTATGTIEVAPVLSCVLSIDPRGRYRAPASHAPGSLGPAAVRFALPRATIRVVDDPDAAVERVSLAPALRVPFVVRDGRIRTSAKPDRTWLGADVELKARLGPETAPLFVKLACETEDGARLTVTVACNQPDTCWTLRDGSVTIRWDLQTTLPPERWAPLARASRVRAEVAPDPRAARLAGYSRVAWFAPVPVDGGLALEGN